MATQSLPSTLDFKSPINYLPDGCSSTLMSLQSTNGIQYSAGQQIQFDLPSRAGLYIDPKSVFIRYKVTYTNGATANAALIKRKPVYTNFARLDEFVGSTPVSSVYSYNQVANMYIDCNFSISDVLGQQFSWGLNQAVALDDLDGVVASSAAANGTSDYYVAAPLVCSFLSNCDKLIPTGLMAPIRVQLTVETTANIATVPANLAAVTIIQPELCFTAIDMGSAVDAMVASMGPTLLLKSRAWANASQSLAAGTQGFSNLVYNHRFKSIENLYLISSSNNVAKALNTWGDSFNPLGTSGVLGTVQVQVGQILIPQLPINNSNGGVASLQQYLRECTGFLSDNRNSMAITNTGFNQYAGDGNISLANNPAKCIIAFPLSRLNAPSPYQQNSLMSGVDASSMPLNILLNAGSAFNSAMNFYLIAEYDVIVQIDPMSKQIVVIQ